MTDIEMTASEHEGPAAASTNIESGPYAAILPLVRLLARQAAREDYARALEAARARTYSTAGAEGVRKTVEES